DLLYDIPAIRVEYVRHEEPALNTGFWRGVGVTHNTFVIESFINELAAAAKQDPVAYRRALRGKSARAKAVLDVAAREAGWGRPLPEGRGRGVSVLYSSWGSYLAAVAEVSVSEASEVRVHRVVCAVDCGTVVNPDTVKAQIEGGIIFGIGGALWGAVTLETGRTQQSNFHDVRVLRLHAAPAIAVPPVTGLFEPIASVVLHPRCINCHQDECPRQTDEKIVHRPFVVRGKEDHGAPTQPCQTCHQATNTADGFVPGVTTWRLAPLSML